MARKKGFTALAKQCRLARGTLAQTEEALVRYLNELFFKGFPSAEASKVIAAVIQLRHGGASHELTVRARPLDEIKKRGRGLTDTSLRRYKKVARLPELLAGTPRERQLEAVAAVSRIGKLLACGLQALPVGKHL